MVYYTNTGSYNWNIDCIICEWSLYIFLEHTNCKVIRTRTNGTTTNWNNSLLTGEYLSGEFKTYLKSKGIRHELTVPHTPEQNGVAERMNRTLMETAPSMIAHAGLSDKYCTEAVATATYIQNRTPTTAVKNNTTPHEQWYERKPNIGHLKVFGCIAYAHIPDNK